MTKNSNLYIYITTRDQLIPNTIILTDINAPLVVPMRAGKYQYLIDAGSDIENAVLFYRVLHELYVCGCNHCNIYISEDLCMDCFRGILEGVSLSNNVIILGKEGLPYED